MPFPLNLHGRVLRHTYWSDSKGNIVQVETCVINEATWDELARVTKALGPFDHVKAELQDTQREALAAADRQFDGQLSL